MQRNTKRGLFASIGAGLLSLSLALTPVLSASATTTKYYDFGTYTSKPAGATADGSYTGHAVASTAGEGTGVHGVLYDTAQDGKGARFVATINFYDKNQNFDGLSTKVAEELDGYGKHKAFDLYFSWPKGSTSGTLTLAVCNGKSGSTYLNCGSDHDFKL